MDGGIDVVYAEPQTLAVVRRTAAFEDLDRVVAQALGEVWDFVRAKRLRNTGTNVIVYRDGTSDFECGVHIVTRFDASGSVFAATTPEGLAATAVHVGPYHLLPKTHAAIRQWCVENRKPLAAPCWEIYGHWTDDASELRTDVFYLLAG